MLVFVSSALQGGNIGANTRKLKSPRICENYKTASLLCNSLCPPVSPCTFETGKFPSGLSEILAGRVFENTDERI